VAAALVALLMFVADGIHEADQRESSIAQPPLASMAPPQVAATIDAGLAEGLGESAIDTRLVGSRSAAVEAIRNSDVRGAFVPRPNGTEVLIATGATPRVAQLLTQAKIMLPRNTRACRCAGGD
jgi:hypothetical protein